MCNCEPRRVPSLPLAIGFGVLSAADPIPTPTAAPRAKPLFEYVGRTALTVTGPSSGMRYRFERPGARLAVDPRDRQGMAAVPLLRACSDVSRPALA